MTTSINPIINTAGAAPVVVSVASAASPAVARIPHNSQIRIKELKASGEIAEIMNVSEAAAFLRAAPATVRLMCKQGLIPCRRILKRFYISRAALLAYLDHFEKQLPENGDYREIEKNEG